MADQRIADAVRAASDTRHVVIEAGALAAVDRVLAEGVGAEAAAVVVADETTMRVAGAAVDEALRHAGRDVLDPHVLPARPVLYADYDNVTKVATALRRHAAIPVAVGSGTINDIVKRAAHECERPYMSVATAASMDGYTAFGAAITKDGYKRTMECPAPRAVVADLDVLTGAPPAITAPGYADRLGKVAAGAAWFVADALGVEPISGPGWHLVQPGLRAAVGRPADLRAGDPGAMRALIDGLVMAGLAMQAQQSSRTASGAEHQFSHLWEMEGLGKDADPPLSHGFKVGVGSVAIAAIYELLLERDLDDLDIEALRDSWPNREEMERSVREQHTNPELEEGAVEQTLAKYIGADELAGRLRLLGEVWPELREKVREQLMPAARIKEMLEAAGCPTTPVEIGLGWEDFEKTYARAQTIRKRYTVLDLASETGLLDGCVAELFAPDGFWGRVAASRARTGGT